MVEPREDMLPPSDPSGIIETGNNPVGGDIKSAIPAPVVQEDTSIVPSPEPKEPAGSKTPPHLLLKSLQEERDKRREAEQRVKELESSSQSYDSASVAVSDEGKALEGLIREQTEQIARLVLEKEQERVYGQFPQLKDKASEFETFKADYPGVTMERAAKLFLVENDLLAKPSRKGLEKASGGPKTATPSGIPAAEIDRLMKDEPKRFAKMLQRGEIDVDRIV